MVEVPDGGGKTIFALLDGIFAFVALTKAEKGRRVLLILQGVLGIALGLIISKERRTKLAMIEERREPVSKSAFNRFPPTSISFTILAILSFFPSLALGL